MPDNFVTKSQYARHRGVAPRTVSDWAERGILIWRGGRVDVEASDAVLNARPAKYRGGVATAPAGPITPPEPVVELPKPTHHFTSADWSLAEAARKKEIAIALKRQLDFDVAAGKLISATDVESIVRSDYAVTVQRILQIPSKVAPRVAAMSSAAEVEALLHREFVKALNTLSEAAGEELKKFEAKA
jgi:phage terminase Nu1 subunit (DNA packaging protein)